MKGFLRLFLGIVLALFFGYLIWNHLDWQIFRRTLAAADLTLIFFSLILLALGYSVRVARWWWMLRRLDPTLPYRTCVTPFLFSYALNNLLPARAGDIMRVMGFRRELGASGSQILGTVFIERLLDLLVLLGFLFIGLAGLPPNALPGSFLRMALCLTCLGFFAVFLAMLAPGLITSFLAYLSSSAFFHTHAWLGKVATWSQQFAGALSLCRSPLLFFQLLAFSAIAWTLEGGVFALVAWSVNTQGSPYAPWFALATGTLATLLPSTPGYLGTFDYFALQGLAAYGARYQEALAFALLIHVVLWLPVTLAGLAAYLAVRGMPAWSHLKAKLLAKNQVPAND
jgi:hypothetical protein